MWPVRAGECSRRSISSTLSNEDSLSPPLAPLLSLAAYFSSIAATTFRHIGSSSTRRTLSPVGKDTSSPPLPVPSELVSESRRPKSSSPLLSLLLFPFSSGGDVPPGGVLGPPARVAVAAAAAASAAALAVDSDAPTAPALVPPSAAASDLVDVHLATPVADTAVVHSPVHARVPVRIRYVRVGRGRSHARDQERGVGVDRSRVGRIRVGVGRLGVGRGV